MKANINLRTLIAEQADSPFQVPATIELDDWFDACDIAEDVDVDIDLRTVLQESRQIAHIWDVGDVKTLRPDLSEDDAWEVLQAVESQLDSAYGINWTTIQNAADDLFPAKRKVRTAKAGQVIADYDPNGDERENLVDLLSDTMHWCQAFGEPFDEFCGTARLHFAEEIKSCNKEA